ncbi:30S ribosomal protein S18 1 [bacterium HR34]|nr:30S ribosomal protein S18 1 [bacterium HR34]
MVCYFCQKNIKEIDFKDTQLLQKYISAMAKIKHRKKTGNCQFHQKRIAQAIKRARFLGLLPFTPQ